MVKLNKIYTRTGDDGATGLVDGSRLPKYSVRIQAIGMVDEANAAIGLAVVALEEREGAAALRHIQNDLFDLGADLATPRGEEEDADFTPSETRLRIVPAQVEWLEGEIDRINQSLEPLTSFILPGGTEAAARLHLARATVRRAECVAVGLAATEETNPAAMAYLNRLSDYLFVLSRFVNAAGEGDILWRPGANR